MCLDIIKPKSYKPVNIWKETSYTYIWYRVNMQDIKRNTISSGREIGLNYVLSHMSLNKLKYQ